MGNFNYSCRIVVDGNIPNWIGLEVIQLNNVGNAPSFRFAYQEAAKCPEVDWVYFSEDDYLYLPDAMSKLFHCIEDVNPDLISLYDHPDRYRDRPEHNLTNGKNDIFISRDHHWRTVPSTCMTFAASISVLKENQDLFERWETSDNELFPRLLGLRGEERPKKYMMVGAIPALATHCESSFLSPCVNWEKVVECEA
jgi:hypothetical protein